MVLGIRCIAGKEATGMQCCNQGVFRQQARFLRHQFLQDGDNDAPSLVDVLQLPPAKQHIDHDLILVLQELARLVHLGLDIVIAGFGAHADFFQFLLMRPRLGLLVGLLVAKLAVIQDLADRGCFRRRPDQVELGLAKSSV